MGWMFGHEPSVHEPGTKPMPGQKAFRAQGLVLIGSS